MSDASHERPGRRPSWRVATVVVGLLCGGLFAVSAEESDGTDLRGGRLRNLSDVVRAEREETQRLTDQVASLSAEVEQLGASLGDRSVDRVQSEVETLTDPAGLTPRTGPALRVTLTDAPEDVRLAYEGDPNDMVVHQQDIQAVANALWRGGATAVTIQGQRLVSTTGIKCEGPEVTLHGVPYPPPYVIVGIGPIDTMQLSLDDDHVLDIYRQAAALPEGGLGYQVETLASATAPPYEGLLDLRWAEPMDS